MNYSPASSAKAALREQALARRDALSPEARATGSAAIAERARAIIAATRPRCVAGYLPFASEVDPCPAMTWAADNSMATAVPAMVDADTMVFRAYRAGDPLLPDAFGIVAPTPSAPAVTPDLILMPLSAFDRQGRRIGKGRGFYDRIVAALRAHGGNPLLVGVAFSVQEVEAVPDEPHDARLHRIVTERETVAARRPD